MTPCALFAVTASFRMKEPNSKNARKPHRLSPQDLSMTITPEGKKSYDFFPSGASLIAGVSKRDKARRSGYMNEK
jgi:hypothetical protein